MAPGPGHAREGRRKGKRPVSVMWHTIVSPTGREKTGYPTQKPEGLLRRFVQASSPRGRPVPGPVRRLGHARRGRAQARPPLPADRREPGGRPGDAGAPCRLSRVVAFGPGRVNLIGEHTDYNDGLAMPFAIERGVTVTATPAERFVVDALRPRRARRVRPSPSARDGWRAFARGMVAELRAAGFDVRARAPGDHRRPPAGQRALAPPRRSRPRSALALLGATPPEDLQGARQAVLARRERLGRRRDRPAGPVRVPAVATPATCCGSTSARSTSSRIPLDLGDWQLVTLDSGATHSHRRAPATTSAAPSAARPARRSASPRCATRRPRARSTARCSSAPATWSARTRASTRRRAALDAHDLETRRRAARRLARLAARRLRGVGARGRGHRRRLKAAGAAGARMVGGGFGGSVLALLPPGVARPPGALASPRARRRDSSDAARRVVPRGAAERRVLRLGLAQFLPERARERPQQEDRARRRASRARRRG